MRSRSIRAVMRGALRRFPILIAAAGLMVAGSGIASATGNHGPAWGSPSGECAQSDQVRWTHTWDAQTKAFTISYLGDRPLCDAQQFTMASWLAHPASEFHASLPQVLVGTVGGAVSKPGDRVSLAGKAVPTGCAAQWDVYAVGEGDVPKLLTESIHEPPIVGADWPSYGPRSYVDEFSSGQTDCVKPGEAVPTAQCSAGGTDSHLTVAVHNPNAYPIDYEVDLNPQGSDKTISKTVPQLAGGASTTVDFGPVPKGEHSVTVSGTDGSHNTVAATVAADCTPTAPPAVSTTTRCGTGSQSGQIVVTVTNPGTAPQTFTVSTGTGKGEQLTVAAGKSGTVTVAASTGNAAVRVSGGGIDVTKNVELSCERQPATRCAVGDTVWMDTNANGVQDEGEKGRSGVTVQLVSAGGTVVSTTATAENGHYLFDDLTCASYSVRFVKPAGTGFTATGKGTPATDSDANTTSGASAVVALGAGKTGSHATTAAETAAGVTASTFNPTVDAGLIVAAPAAVPAAANTPAATPLAFTGAAVTGLVVLGVVVLGAGAGLVLIGRRRRGTPAAGR